MDKYQSKPWLKSYEPGIPINIMYENISLPEMLEKSAYKFSHKIALIFQGYKMSYHQLNSSVNNFATFLVKTFEVKKGDVIAILLPNIIPCVISYFAILKIGGIVVMNNPLYSDRELKYQLNDSKAKVLITLDLLVERMIKLRKMTKIKQIVYTSINDYLTFSKKIIFYFFYKKIKINLKKESYIFKWKTCLKKETISFNKINLNDIAMYQYTGGTTGISKGVILTHANLSKQVQQLKAWFPNFSTDNERMLSALPFFHVFGLSTAMNLSIYMGWTNILIPKPKSKAILYAIQKFKPTFLPLIPTMYISMLNDPNFKKTNMKCIKGCFSGSAPLPLNVLYEFEKFTGILIVEGFGMTETTPVTHINPFSKKNRKIGSIGLPLPDTDVKIVNIENGKYNVKLGEIGELIIKGPQVMLGYLNRDDETSNTLRKGWCYTGDIAKMDKDGYFYIIDRKKDVIITSGYNVYPKDIDEVFCKHPKVNEVATIGIPDSKRGENIKVFLVLKNNVTATEKEFIEYCKDKLAIYKWPTKIQFCTKLPKNSIGKILRNKLK